MAKIKYAIRLGLDPIPEGIYAVDIFDSKRVEMKDGSGDTLQLVLRVIEGEFSGRKLFDWIDIWSSDRKKWTKARNKLNQILRAVKINSIEDSCELHSLPLAIRVIHLGDRRDDKEPFVFVEEYFEKEDK